MALIAKNSGGSFEPIPIGIHQAVCYAIYDIGTHRGEYQGKTVTRHQIVVCWELDCAMQDGRPFGMSKFYTLSLHEKSTLRKDLESWRGKKFTPEELDGFDVEKLIGVNCTLSVIDSEKSDGSPTQKISAIMPNMPQAQNMTAVNPSGPAPAWIEKKRAESLEAQRQMVNDAGGNSEPARVNEENLPF